MKLDAKQLRITSPVEGDLEKITRKPIWLILDNVLDTYNIGGLFRLAEAVTATELVLCGGSETPPSSRIHKAAVGTEKWVPWRYFSSAKEAIENLRTQNPELKVMVVEKDNRSVSLESEVVFKKIVKNGQLSPVAIVVGHETDGVSKQVIDTADLVVEIPMWGVNKSLNVIVSAAVVTYTILGFKQGDK